MPPTLKGGVVSQAELYRQICCLKERIEELVLSQGGINDTDYPLTLEGGILSLEISPSANNDIQVLVDGLSIDVSESPVIDTYDILGHGPMVAAPLQEFVDYFAVETDLLFQSALTEDPQGVVRWNGPLLEQVNIDQDGYDILFFGPGSFNIGDTVVGPSRLNVYGDAEIIGENNGLILEEDGNRHKFETTHYGALISTQL